MRYNTNLFEQVANVPTPYIEVNQRSSENKSGDKGSIIVRFDWATHIKFMKNTSDDYNQKYFNLFSSHFLNYLGTCSEGFADINKLINDSLLQARVTLSNALGGNNASIVLENFDNRWTFLLDTIPELYGACIFSEGIYVSIDAKGRFNSDRYYRIFVGTINQINVMDSPTDRRINLSFTDYSRFLRYTRYNIHPAVNEKDILAEQSVVTIWGTKLADLDNVEIAKKILPDRSKKPWTDRDKINLDFKDLWTNQKIEDDWYASINTSLGDTEIVDRNFMYSYSIENSSYDIDDNVYDPVSLLWGNVKPKTGDRAYQVYANIFGRFVLFASEFKTGADILNETAFATLFICYVDGAGNIHYHPPRYEYIRNDKAPYVLGLYDELTGKDENPFIHVLLEEESIEESYTQNEDDIVTRLWVNLESDFGINLAKKKVDPNLVRLNIIWSEGIKQYGLRERTLSTAAFADIEPAKSFGLALFIRILLERKKMSTTMPMRAELQVDRPFHVPHKRMVYHIKSLTHTYIAGGERSAGTYTTTVDCFAGRPLQHATMLMPNIFKDVTYETVKNNLKQIGYDITINRNTLPSEAKK